MVASSSSSVNAVTTQPGRWHRRLTTAIFIPGGAHPLGPEVTPAREDRPLGAAGQPQVRDDDDAGDGGPQAPLIRHRVRGDVAGPEGVATVRTIPLVVQRHAGAAGRLGP